MDLINSFPDFSLARCTNFCRLMLPSQILIQMAFGATLTWARSSVSTPPFDEERRDDVISHRFPLKNKKTTMRYMYALGIINLLMK